MGVCNSKQQSDNNNPNPSNNGIIKNQSGSGSGNNSSISGNHASLSATAAIAAAVLTGPNSNNADPATRAVRESSRRSSRDNTEIKSNTSTGRHSDYEDVQHLLTIPFFEELETKHLKDLRSIFHRRNYAAGEIIVRQGAPESCFHVIVSGCVELSARDSKNNSVILHEFRKNEWFGSITLVENSIAAVEVVAKEETTLLYIRSDEFDNKMKQFPDLSVRLNVLGTEPVSIQLRKIPFFTEIDELTLQQLGTLCEIRKFREGTMICSQNAQADGLYFIIAGRVEVTVESTPAKSESAVISTGGNSIPAAASLISTNQQSLIIASDGSSIIPINNNNHSNQNSPTAAEVKARRSLDRNEKSVNSEQSAVLAAIETAEKRVHLDTLSDGDFFGEISLIMRTRRTATVTAIKDCILLYLSRARFDRFLHLAPAIAEGGIFERIIQQRTGNSLKAIPIFSALKRKQVGPLTQYDEPRLALLGALFKYMNVDQGTLITTEGEWNDSFYIIVSGSCAISAKTPDDMKQVTLAVLRAHDFFGESSLFNRTRCNATVTALEPCILLRLRGENFQQLCRIVPEVEQLLKQRVGARTAERLKRIPFFSAIRENKPWSKLDLLGNLFVFEEFPSGSIVFREQDIGDKFYIIVSGQCEISVKKADDAVFFLDTQSENSHFGEIGLIKKVPRTATVQCKTDCVLLSVTAKRFQQFMEIAPELSDHFHALLQHRTANMLRTIDLFTHVIENKPWSKLEALGAMLNYEQSDSGETVFPIDQFPTNKFYLLINGSVKVIERDGRTKIIKAQAHFGAADVLREKPRSCSVVAIERSVFLVLQKASFKAFLRIAPELIPLFDEIVSTRIRESLEGGDSHNHHSTATATSASTATASSSTGTASIAGTTTGTATATVSEDQNESKLSSVILAEIQSEEEIKLELSKSKSRMDSIDPKNIKITIGGSAVSDATSVNSLNRNSSNTNPISEPTSAKPIQDSATE